MSAVYILATRSTDKQREIGQLLHGTARILTLDDAGIDASPAEDDIEKFETFRENAIAKARYFRDLTGRPVIADDSGIVVDALDGAPGVRSKRFANRTDLAGTELDRENNRLVAEMLATRGGPGPAHYVCVAALAAADGHIAVAIGACTGVFLLEPRGTNGFGYDPHFYMTNVDRTFGQMSDTEKHGYSHRARAFRALIPLL